jgi:hypothetical protein
VKRIFFCGFAGVCCINEAIMNAVSDAANIHWLPTNTALAGHFCRAALLYSHTSFERSTRCSNPCASPSAAQA